MTCNLNDHASEATLTLLVNDRERECCEKQKAGEDGERDMRRNHAMRTTNEKRVRKVEMLK